MCGILGQINLKGNLNNDEDTLFSHALLMMYHRGPNAQSFIKRDFAKIGHTRLSIIDLNKESNQPFYSFCKNYVVIFNGEIYNYRELKKQLINKGYKFKTNSDTEVLLNLLIEKGSDALEELNGMFSFCFIDFKNKKTLLARDRLGIKPLYYSFDSQNLYFASEVPPILKLLHKKHILNKEALVSYFIYRYPILNDTFFKGIYSLPPAHFIKLENKKYEISKYWYLENNIKEQKIDKGENFYKSNLRTILDEAIEKRMLSDVPIGSFLSGGVDSSVITSIMAIKQSSPINSFTIGFENKNYQEFEYSNEVSKRYKTNHKEIVVKPEEYFQELKNLILLKGSPLSVPNEVALYLMSKEMKKSITVVLSGEGADEIFGGYGRIFRSSFDLERMNNIRNKKNPDLNEKEFMKKIQKKYGESKFKNEIDHFINIYGYMKNNEIDKLFIDKELLKDSQNKFHNKIAKTFEESKSKNYLNKMIYCFEKIHLPGLLGRVDSSTMAASIEARVPFVDHKLVEFAFKIPIKYKIKWIDKESAKHLISDEISEKYDIPKYILKETYRDLLSPKILYRKKMGFPVPLNEWIGGDFFIYAKELLLNKNAKIHEFLNQNKINDMLMDKELITNHSKAMKIWNILNLELFLSLFFNK